MTTSDHYSTSRNRTLYRARDGMIFGVIKGLAKYADLSAFWLRIVVVGLAIFTWFFPVAIIYLIMAIVMKPEPVLAPVTIDDEEFYSSYAASKTMALSRLKKRFEQLERRARRIETVITDREYEWDERLRRS